eukprot:scaffold1254_cov251-Pinguiococcus_pyrenoidosus.AAC.15
MGLAPSNSVYIRQKRTTRFASPVHFITRPTLRPPEVDFRSCTCEATVVLLPLSVTCGWRRWTCGPLTRASPRRESPLWSPRPARWRWGRALRRSSHIRRIWAGLAAGAGAARSLWPLSPWGRVLDLLASLTNCQSDVRDDLCPSGARAADCGYSVRTSLVDRNN